MSGDELIGKDKAAQRLREAILKIARTDMTVLIQGETGTGKELVASAIHEQSLRAKGPYVAMNCASMADTLVESELFGHEKGAFTGAVATKKGKFEQADNGTIFLDEIGEISPAVQVKLLRVIQERKVDRIGGQKPLALNFRLITATNKNLESMVSAGTFRADLLYRLQVGVIQTPPLRGRPDVIAELALHFTRRYGIQKFPPVEVISKPALDILRRFSWPGNVRELDNVIQWAVHNCASGMLEPHDLAPGFLQKAAAPGGRTRNYNETMRAISRGLCIMGIAEAKGSWRKAARSLGLSRTTFTRIAKSHGLGDPLDN